ncbi:MAG: hypothetical protein ACMUJM_00465 [bacterium]
MFKKFSYIINFILILVILYIIISFNKIAGPMFAQLKSAKEGESLAQHFMEERKDIEAEELESPDFTPASRSRYALIADKDLFRPEREEWYPPPPPEEMGEELEVSSSIYGRGRNLQELPKPTLSGIVIIGENKKYAIMQGHVREEVEIPENAKGKSRIRRPPRQPRLRIKQDKAKPYHIGDEVSEYQIVDILANAVIIEKNGVKEELLLRQDLTIAGLNEQGEQEAGNMQGFPQAGFPPGYNPQIPLPPGYNPQGAYPPQGFGLPGQMPGQRFQPGLVPGQIPGQGFQPGIPPGQQIPPHVRNWQIQRQRALAQSPASGQPLQRPGRFPQSPLAPGFPPQGGMQTPFYQPQGGVPQGNVPAGMLPNNYDLDQPLEQEFSY